MFKHIVDNAYSISRGIDVRKVSDSKYDLEGHSRTLTMVPFDRPHIISYYRLPCNNVSIFY